MRSDRQAFEDNERGPFLIAMAVLGVTGCLCLITGTFIAQLFVPDHDWIADTISDLAAGRWEIVMDIALYGFAAGIMAVALGAAHAHPGGAGWSVGTLSLAVLAALVVTIAARNEYGDGDSEGVPIHTYLVYGLGIFFLIMPVTLGFGIGRQRPWARYGLWGLAVLWALSAPVFFFLPTGIDGLYERVLGMIASAMICVLCRVFWLWGRNMVSD